MNVHSPPPPSPSCSEPPPSYDSLSPLNTHPLPVPSVPSSLTHHPLHSATTTAISLHPNQETNATDEELDDLPPPPYSPGLGDTQDTSQQQYEGMEGPPSYYSLFGQIQEARQQTSSNIVFLRKLCHIIMNTVGCTLLLIILTFVPLAVLVLGVVFVHDCPLQPYIPVFLIIGGLAGLIKNMLLITENVVRKKSASILPRVRHPKLALWTWRLGNLVFNLLLVAWVIAGSYWVYGTYMQIISDEYASCNAFLYKFAFAFVTCSYIFLLMMFSCMCFLAGAVMRKSSPRVGGGGTTRSPSGPAPPPEATPSNPTPPPPSTPEAMPSRSTLNEANNVEAPSNLPSLPAVIEEGEADPNEAGIRRFGMGYGVGMGNGSIGNEHTATREVAAPDGLENDNIIAVHGSMGNLTGPSHSPLTTPTSATAASYQRSYSHSGSRNHRSHQQLPPLSSELPSPAPNSRPFLLTFESSPYPSRQLHPFTRQASFGSNDMGMHLRPPLHTAASFSSMRGSKSFSPMISRAEESNATHKSMNRPRSIPYLYESHSSYEVEPRYCGPGNDNLLDSGCDSNRSSLYTTSHLDGFSITAV